MAWRYDPHDRTIHTHCSKNLKSNKIVIFSVTLLLCGRMPTFRRNILPPFTIAQVCKFRNRFSYIDKLREMAIGPKEKAGTQKGLIRCTLFLVAFVETFLRNHVYSWTYTLQTCGWSWFLRNISKVKVKLFLYQAVEAHRVVRRRGSHIF
jgi:hypothetical protein